MEEGEIITPKNSRSKVWDYFRIISRDGVDDRTNAYCTLCDLKTVSYGGSTTNLFSHLQHHHQAEYLKIKKPQEDSKQPPITESFGNLSKSKEERITEAIGKMIFMDLQPISILSDPGFLNLLKILEPRYKPISRSYMAQTILPDIYAKTKEVVLKEIEGLEFCGFSTDIWTSCSHEAYITVNMHYLSEEFKFKNRILSTKGFPGSHTGQTIAECLGNVFLNRN
jgi:hypothetical protein